MTNKSFKIDHDLDNFGAIDLDALQDFIDYGDELPINAEITAHNEINYPTFQNAITTDKELQKYTGL